MKHVWLIIILLAFAGCSIAQQYSSGSKKAVKRFEEARTYFQDRDDVNAEEALLKAINADRDFVEAYQLLAQICYDHGRIEDAIGYYTTSLEIDPSGNPDGYRLLAGLTIRAGDYHRTLELVETFLSFPPEEVRMREAGVVLKEKCHFALDAIEKPVPFQPENLGDSVNSAYNEYWPSLSVDENMIMFTVMLPGNPEAGESPLNLHEDFFYSRRTENKWNGRINAGAPLNTPDNEGAHTMTADGRLLYFTACNRRDGKGKCDLYVSRWEDGSWGVPANLGSPVNSRYSEKHPTISADGRVLYFTSNRPRGKGSYDIWLSVKSGNKWNDPINLGDSINSPGMEQSPFIHPDQQTLFFSSTGWPGMGQGDLFLSRLTPERTWSEPVNLGYPINTYNDEIGLTVNARGDRAYFASDRQSGRDTDIYTFELPPEARPVLVSYMRGRVYDSRNMKGLKAVLQLIDLETEETVMEVESVPGEGDYLISLPTDRDYALNVSADGYLFYSDHFTFSGLHSRKDPFRRDIPLDRIIVGSRVVLHNVFFDTDSHELQPASIAELNKVQEFLDLNPSIAVEISGHTDNTGTTGHNQKLSEQRAHAVVNFLMNKGINVENLKPAGYGDREPVADNTTEEGRAQNRRTELKIIRIHPASVE
ncbi:MAG: PD40 domain-containing protein [Bacteroidales bacterium]|nr:PD40 domain-containing protein [Bacteroidales bacterium]